MEQQTPVVALLDEAAAQLMALHGDAAALHVCAAAPLHVDEHAPLLDADAIHANVEVLHKVEAGTGVRAGAGAGVSANHG